MMNLNSGVKLQRVINATAVGTTTINGAVVDTAGFDTCRFIVAFGTITDGTPDVKVQQGSQDDGSDMADLAGTLVTLADTDDNDMAVVEVTRPRERYLRCVVVRGGATGSVIDGAIAELGNARRGPVTHGSTVAASETHASPAEGTA